jgi:hypothetical protein
VAASDHESVFVFATAAEQRDGRCARSTREVIDLTLPIARLRTTRRSMLEQHAADLVGSSRFNRDRLSASTAKEVRHVGSASCFCAVRARGEARSDLRHVSFGTSERR